MSSTVTTTVSTVSTVFFASLSLILAITLLILIINKEILINSTHPFAQALRRILNAAIVPLVIGFSILAFVSFMEAMK
jgi:hypothetical protein